MLSHEVNASTTPESIAARIADFGVALIRSATLPPDDWATCFVSRLERIGRGEEDGAPFTAYYQIGAGSLDMVGPEVAEWFMRSPLSDVARSYFRAEVFIDPAFSRVRIARPPTKALFASHGFHQDAMGVAYCGDDPDKRPPMLTFWVALTDAGIDAPGLEYIPIAQTKRRNLKADEHWTDPTDDTDPALVEAIRLFGAENLVHPVVTAGDVLILAENTYHRTYATRAMTKARVSMDIRVRAVES